MKTIIRPEVRIDSGIVTPERTLEILCGDRRFTAAAANVGKAAMRGMDSEFDIGRVHLRTAGAIAHGHEGTISHVVRKEGITDVTVRGHDDCGFCGLVNGVVNEGMRVSDSVMGIVQPYSTLAFRNREELERQLAQFNAEYLGYLLPGVRVTSEVIHTDSVYKSGYHGEKYLIVMESVGQFAAYSDILRAARAPLEGTYMVHGRFSETLPHIEIFVKGLGVGNVVFAAFNNAEVGRMGADIAVLNRERFIEESGARVSLAKVHRS